MSSCNWLPNPNIARPLIMILYKQGYLYKFVFVFIKLKILLRLIKNHAQIKYGGMRVLFSALFFQDKFSHKVIIYVWYLKKVEVTGSKEKNYVIKTLTCIFNFSSVAYIIDCRMEGIHVTQKCKVRAYYYHDHVKNYLMGWTCSSRKKTKPTYKLLVLNHRDRHLWKT